MSVERRLNTSSFLIRRVPLTVSRFHGSPLRSVPWRLSGKYPLLKQSFIPLSSATARYTAGTFSFPQACSQSILALPTPGIHSRTGTRKRSNRCARNRISAGRGIGYCPTSASLTGHTLPPLSYPLTSNIILVAAELRYFI